MARDARSAQVARSETNPIEKLTVASLPEPQPLEAVPLTLDLLVVAPEHVPALEIGPIVPAETKVERR